VTEMGGHIAKKLGDGLMVLFGYPVAQENDAERAARAALSIQRALAELNRKNAGSGKPVLSARIGIETGPVVVDAAGEIYGDAPNTAARVQALAEPSTVVVTARVQRQVAGLFVAEERGAHDLKGVPEPVTLFQLVRASGGGRRPGQRHLTPLVGREEEIAMLMRRWERARQGDGQLVLIVGEPGLGKSRLVQELHNRVRELAENSDRVRQELAFQTVLGPALLATKGWGAPEALATYLRARELSEKLGDTARLFASLWGMWLIRWARGEISVASGLVEELLDLARREGRTTFRLQAHHAGWTTCTYLGDLKTAIHHAERGVAVYSREEHSTLAIGYGGHDPGVCARAHASQPLWLIGYPDKALHSSQQSLTLSHDLSHNPTVTHALFHAAWLHQFRRDERAARDKAEALIATATDQGQAMYVAIGTIFLGCLRVCGSY
jgi:Adenylate and Guanylate cyclase catalytic domain/AAA ATPase domain